MKALDDMVMHAEPDELINALVRRGAATRPLSDGRLKLAMVFRVQPTRTHQRPKRRTVRQVDPNDPRLVKILGRIERANGERDPRLS